jgi:hypothetical protein
MREWREVVRAAGETVVDAHVALVPEGGASQGGAAAAVTPSRAGASSTTRTLGLVVGGVGVASAAVGVVAGVVAIGKRSDAVRACEGSYPSACAAGAENAVTSANDGARSAALVATVGLALGAVGIAAGAILFFFAPSKPASASASASPTWRVVPAVGAHRADARGAAIEGSW